MHIISIRKSLPEILSKGIIIFKIKKKHNTTQDYERSRGCNINNFKICGSKLWQSIIISLLEVVPHSIRKTIV